MTAFEILFAKLKSEVQSGNAIPKVIPLCRGTRRF